jgi:alpha-L-arabinofuranosidase
VSPAGDGGPLEASAVIDPAAVIGEVDERLFGSFVEHMGRAVYGGIYEPGHPSADRDGWRHDVVELVRELGVTIVRYPGGNFVSGYAWEDGVGPRDTRPTRLDRAWRSIETNAVGTDDFIDWARLVGADPMLAVNLGTRGAEAARDLVEYCNGRTGTALADRRAANGHAAPYGVRVWCLGNEMDGPWQIGHTSAVEYGRLAAETGRAMRAVDPSIELVACGSSGPRMPTFGAWDEAVLDLTLDVADYISVHCYVDRAEHPDAGAYLGASLELDRTIRSVAAIADAVGARHGSAKGVDLSVDEWNVWHLAENPIDNDSSGPFRAVRPMAEDEHDMTDALVVGCLLITLLRNADRVRIACLAQLVNVIPPIRTLDGGPAWRQTTFFPFADVTSFGKGRVVRVEPVGPAYRLADGAEIPGLEATAVVAFDGSSLTIFAVNRLDQSLTLDAVVHDRPASSAIEHRALSDPDPSASNSADRPDRVRPRRLPGATLDGDRLAVVLPPRSWNVVRLAQPAGESRPSL